MALSDVSPESPYYEFFKTVPTRALSEKDDGRNAKLSRAWDAYNGVFPKPLKVKPGSPDDNVIINMQKRVVDASVAFLFGKGVTWNLGEESLRSPEEEWLDAVWRFNKKMLLLHRLGTNGGVCGQVFLKLRVARPYPELKVLDPTSVTVECRDDDHEYVLSYTIRWNGKNREGKPTAYRQVIRRVPEGTLRAEDGYETPVAQHWVILDQEQSLAPGGSVKEEAWITTNTEVWMWSFAPIVECQNLPNPNCYWGIADIEPDGIHINEAINRVASNTNKIIRLHAHPKTYTKGLSENQTKQIRVDADGVIHLPGLATEVEIDNLEMQSDLASSLKFFDELRAAHREVSRTPEVASGRADDLAYLAAMAMQILYGPLIEKTDAKHETYGWLIVETNRRLLAMAGKGEENYSVLVWGNALPRDRQVESQTAVMEQQAGVSRETTIGNMGYDPVHEEGRWTKDREQDLKYEKDLTAQKASVQAAKKPA